MNIFQEERSKITLLLFIQQKNRTQLLVCGFSICGEGGIRTLGTITRTQSFQDCPFDRSGTLPFRISNVGFQINIRNSTSDLQNPKLAEREGFEPSVPVKIQHLSRVPLSAAQAPLQIKILVLTSTIRIIYNYTL